MSRWLQLVLLTLLFPAPALAQTTSPEVVQGEDEAKGRNEAPVFADWPACWFIATSTDLGLFYLRPRVSFGYGRPHTVWAGIDLNPTSSLSTTGGYGGIRIAIPHVDLRVGSRASYSLQRAALVPQLGYDQDELSIRPRDGLLSSRSAYVSAEAELTFDIPIGPTAIIGEVAATYIAFHPKDRFIFEERLLVVVDPPWVGKARLGYRFPVKIKGLAFGVQPAAEVIVAPGRPGPTVRTGLLIKVPLSPRLSVRANLMHTIESPDQIHFTGSNFGELTLRWRSAWSFFR